MSQIAFVNVHGQPVNTNPVPMKRVKKEAPEKFHKGFSVQGHPPGALERGEADHHANEQAVIEHNRRVEAGELQGEARRRTPPLWDAERWLTATKLKKVRSKPYEVPSAAEECKAMAEKAGWLRVVVVEISKGEAE